MGSAERKLAFSTKTHVQTLINDKKSYRPRTKNLDRTRANK